MLISMNNRSCAQRWVSSIASLARTVGDLRQGTHQAHRDVAADDRLGIDDAFRGEKVTGAVDMAFQADAFSSILRNPERLNT